MFFIDVCLPQAHNHADSPWLGFFSFPRNQTTPQLQPLHAKRFLVRKKAHNVRRAEDTHHPKTSV